MNNPDMQSEEILSLLDDYMDLVTGGIPPILNMLPDYFSLADARMTVFRSEDNWALFFEMVGYRSKEMKFGTDLWAYGSCLGDARAGECQDLLIPYCREPFALADHITSIDPETETPRFDRDHFGIWFRGHLLEFRPTDRDYAAARIFFTDNTHGPGSLSAPEMLRFLCHTLEHPFYVSEDYLRYVLGTLRIDKPWCSHDLSLFFQTTQWRHPDIVAEEHPSDVEYFRVLARAIETGDATQLKRQDPSEFNTDWPLNVWSMTVQGQSFS